MGIDADSTPLLSDVSHLAAIPQCSRAHTGCSLVAGWWLGLQY